MPSLIGSDRWQAGSSVTQSQYWRSMDELADSNEFRQFVEQEFPNYAPELLQGPTRRQFLKVMGASVALAGLTGCRWPRETIVPATKTPENRVAGVPVDYATVWELDGVATGLLVKSYDGRPIKIEGNPEHPFSRGKTNHWMQASLLALYDPDRSGVVRKKTERNALSVEKFLTEAKALFSNLRASGGAGLCVLAEPTSGPTMARLRAEFAKNFPQAKWVEYHPLSRDNEREGARLAFGAPLRANYHFDKADVVLSLDADFLMTHPASVRYANDYAARRVPGEHGMSRTIAIEGGVSVTGSNADNRYAVRSSAIPAAGQQILDAVTIKLGQGSGGTPAGPLSPEMVKKIADALAAAKGKSIVIVGERQPAELHALAHNLNGMLGNLGATIDLYELPDAQRPTHATAFKQLVEQMNSGAVKTLVILEGNPVLTSAADVPFAEALAKVPTSLHLSLYHDETSRACTWHAPAAHYLEAWGDARAYDGTLSIAQPLIEPLYSGISPIEFVALMNDGEARRGYDLVRKTFDAGRSGDVEAAWREALFAGVVASSAWKPATPKLTGAAVRMPAAPAAGGDFDLALHADYKIYDGRFGNNSWLQEMPDPITKVTWDNAALISPADAKRLSLRDGDNVTLATGGRSLVVPVIVQPGLAAGALTLSLGYGREPAGGIVASGAGFNAYKLRTTDAPWLSAGTTLSRAAGNYAISRTQDHQSIHSEIGDQQKQTRVPTLVREGTLTEYQAHPDFAKHFVHLPTLQNPWKTLPFDEAALQWGMAIDLAKCTGCGTCLVACQAENNIPVVGKAEVALGREMHWIRIDRYYLGTPDAPSVVHQPVPCMHCENAPCESVCPVAATNHDKEGLNVMVYNRCIGTRYCSNNCPYKVRRFNWFYNHHGPSHPRSIAIGTSPIPIALLKHADLTPVEMMVHNPEVTVRSRGVMEKCTYCVQRINQVKIVARNEKRSIRDGEIVTACAQACPADAITFGNLADKSSRVHAAHAAQRSYSMLEEYNLRPRTQYLARVRNPFDQPAASKGGGHHGDGGEKQSSGHSVPEH